MNPYTILNIEPDADAETIKRAYRNRSKETHPDHGGTSDAFADIQKAYDILNDPEARAEFDATGQFVEAQEVEAILAAAFMDAMHQAGVNSKLIKHTERLLRRGWDSCHESIMGCNSMIESLTKASQRLRGEGVLRQRLDSELDYTRQKLASVEHEVATIKKALQALASYSYDFNEGMVTYQDVQRDLITQIIYRK